MTVKSRSADSTSLLKSNKVQAMKCTQSKTVNHFCAKLTPKLILKVESLGFVHVVHKHTLMIADC